MAVIFCGNVSAMYSYSPGTYSPVTHPPDISPTMITEEDWDNFMAGGGGSSNVQEYVSKKPSSQENVREDGSNIQIGDSSQGTSTELSASTESSPSMDSTGYTGSSAGNAVNNSLNTTTTESGTQAAGDSGKADESSKAVTPSSTDAPWGT